MSMKNILSEPEGSKITVVELSPYMPYKHRNECKDNVLFITYKDDRDKKKVKAIQRPPMEIYFTKPQYRKDWRTPREYVEIDKTFPVTVDSTKVLSAIYHEMQKETDPATIQLLKVYHQANATQNWSARKELYKWQHVFLADIGIEDYYRIMLGYHYNTDRDHTATKCFLDIESDIFGLTSSQTAENEDQTNAVTLIFDHDLVTGKTAPQVYTFLLRNYERYPQQEHFEKHLDQFIAQCHDEYDKVEVIKKGKVQIIDNTADYHILFFDKESDLLASVFAMINRQRPDICAVWNIAYDLPKMYARMLANNMNPVDVMSDPAFPKPCRFVDINVDRRSGIDIADRKTYIKMTSTTKYIDQMQTYANLRKGRKAYGSNKLDNIAELELGVHKRDFAKGIDVTNACIKDYWNFVLYNIKDVWLQYMIDQVTNDLYSLIVDSNQSNCAIENLTKQTRYNKQIYYTEYLRYGVVPGSNINNDYVGGTTDENADMLREMREAARRRAAVDRMIQTGEIGTDDDIDPDDIDIDEFADYDQNALEVSERVVDLYADSIDRVLKLQGAVVGHPNLNSCNGMELVEGIPSKHVFNDVMDMDFASEYPYAKYTRSISRSTQYGRLIIPKKISDRQNEYDFENYVPGSEFTSDYISQDFVSMGNVWFGLPTSSEMADIIKESMKGGK